MPSRKSLPDTGDGPAEHSRNAELTAAALADAARLDPTTTALIHIGKQGGEQQAAADNAGFKAVLWPIAKRIPAYLKLALALIREPTIPARHKSIIYGTLVYQVSPIHWAVTPIPVVGQVDFPVLLILGIRQTLAHCPPDIARGHFARLRLSPTQLDRDADAIKRLGIDVAKGAQRKTSRNMKFVGRVAAGFSRRQVGRLFK